jgi:hypothetical protein
MWKIAQDLCYVNGKDRCLFLSPWRYHVGSIPKTVMNDVPGVPIGDFENTLSFPSEETSLGSGLPSHLPQGDVPCLSSPSHGFLHHTIGTLHNTM